MYCPKNSTFAPLQDEVFKFPTVLFASYLFSSYLHRSHCRRFIEAWWEQFDPEWKNLAVLTNNKRGNLNYFPYEHKKQMSEAYYFDKESSKHVKWDFISA